MDRDETIDATIASLGERAIIREVISPLLTPFLEKFRLDDCAVIPQHSAPPLLVSVDQAPSTSFLSVLNVGTPQDLGHFHVTQNVSDIAAMGGIPFAMLLALSLRQDETISFLRNYLDGVLQASKEYSVPLIGGDTKQSNQRATTITILGYASSGNLLSRKGARSGDLIFISNNPGRVLAGYISAARIDKLRMKPRPVIRPKARLDLGIKLATEQFCTTCMDMSDGLLASAEELGRTNDLVFDVKIADISIEVPEFGPVNLMAWRNFVLNVGGDFELIFTAPREHLEKAVTLGAIQIGEVREAQHENAGISRKALANAGISYSPWEHFKTISSISSGLGDFV